MIYKPYSIVVVPFPFTDSINVKRRPSLVLSSEEHQEQTEHITLIMITSAKHSAWKSDYSITKLETTGLSAPSMIRQKIFTIDRRLVLNALGHLSTQDRTAMISRLNKHLCLQL